MLVWFGLLSSLSLLLRETRARLDGWTAWSVFQNKVFFSSSLSIFFTLQCSLLNVKTLQSKEQKQRKERMEESHSFCILKISRIMNTKKSKESAN